MHARCRWLTSGIAIVSALLIVSCGDGSPQPTALRQAPPPPPPLAPVTLTRVDVSAPERIEPQRSTQLKATAVRSDGTTEEVMSQARWVSFNQSIVRVSSTGEITKFANHAFEMQRRGQS